MGAGKDGWPQTGPYLAFPAEQGDAVTAQGPKDQASLAAGCPPVSSWPPRRLPVSWLEHAAYLKMDRRPAGQGPGREVPAIWPGALLRTHRPGHSSQRRGTAPSTARSVSVGSVD